mmetsp:Transcript_124916/g.347804  ORF Transcript_124916/g.347804 Transcript_124916/m.347804 type:complete len:201 (+) Transcript_124916:622-1224(+)
MLRICMYSTNGTNNLGGKSTKMRPSSSFWTDQRPLNAAASTESSHCESVARSAEICAMPLTLKCTVSPPQRRLSSSKRARSAKSLASASWRRPVASQSLAASPESISCMPTTSPLSPSNSARAASNRSSRSARLRSSSCKRFRAASTSISAAATRPRKPSAKMLAADSASAMAAAESNAMADTLPSMQQAANKLVIVIRT